mmetsp:Transcript_595/g.812  ORF Transcript_595/g.812 Transcript_595/m.812 type:complete len:89 (-) Transcript_595:1328-1594(-)
MKMSKLKPLKNPKAVQNVNKEPEKVHSGNTHDTQMNGMVDLKLRAGIGFNRFWCQPPKCLIKHIDHEGVLLRTSRMHVCCIFEVEVAC